MGTRTTKELLIILRDNLEEYFDLYYENGGMCLVITDLYGYGIITDDEETILFEYLENNKPRNANIRYKKYKDGGGDFALFSNRLHWWKPRAVKPRLKWLNQQINKL